MNTLKTMIAGVSIAGLTGSMSSCTSTNMAVYNSRYGKQLELANKNQEIITNYGVSTLKPNGNLSSIEDGDVLYFNTKQDSTAYDRVNRLSNGIVNKAQAEGRISINKAAKRYIASGAAVNGYQSRYDAFNKSSDTRSVLFDYARKDYKKSISEAEKQAKKLRKDGRKAFCAFVRKNAKIIK